MAADHAGGDRAPVPVHRVWARVAPGHHQGRAAKGEAVPARARLGLAALVVGHLSVARIAEGLGVAWNTANDAVLAEGKRVLIDEATRFDGVRVLGVDEHVWRHTGVGTSTSR